MDIFARLAQDIIKAQEKIIGPVALEQARKVQGLKVNGEVVIEGNKTEVVEHLVEQYRDLFGQASVEICKDAVKISIKDIPKDQLPSLLT